MKLKLIVCTCTATLSRSLLRAWRDNHRRYFGQPLRLHKDDDVHENVDEGGVE